jgi:hypothetical protein
MNRAEPHTTTSTRSSTNHLRILTRFPMMRVASATPRCHPHTARAGLSASRLATAPRLTTQFGLAPQNPGSQLGAPISVGVGRRSPLFGADLASAGFVPSSASTVIDGGVAGPIGCAGRCDGRATENHMSGGLPPKRLVVPNSLLPFPGRRLERGASVSQPIGLFRLMQTDSTSVLTGPVGSETGTALVISCASTERGPGADRRRSILQ